MPVISRSVTGLASLLVCWSACIESATAQCQYEATLIDLGPDGPSVNPRAINEDGTVVGHFRFGAGNDHPFVWTPTGGLQEIDIPSASGRAYDINNAGAVVGTMTSSPRRGFLYENGEVTPLGFPAWANFSEAKAIDDRGVIVGYVGNNLIGPNHAAVWIDGVYASLDKDLAVHSSTAEDINATGQITGKRIEAPGIQDCGYLWEAGSITDLGPIPGGVSSRAFAIGDAGHITGVGNVPPPEGGVCWHVFVWHQGGMVDLGEGSVGEVNAHGHVVGIFVGERSVNAFIWQHGVSHDLNTLVMDLDPAIHLRSAADINNHGVIVVDSEGSGSGIGVVLTPVARPTTDLNYDCRTDAHDLQMLLEQWGAEDSSADFDRDGLGPV